MTQRNFHIRAVWDAEASVWYSDSDISGLHIEAATFEEFQSAVNEFAAELIVENHYAGVDLTQKPLAELIPAIMISQVQGTSKVG